MKNAALAVFVCLCTFVTASVLVKNAELRKENRRLTSLIEQTQNLNRGFETALVSCRLSLDGMVADSQEVVMRKMFNFARYRYLRANDPVRVAQVYQHGHIHAGQ